MANRNALYRYSLEDAVYYHEEAFWRESHKNNCDCARAIERSIAEHYDGQRLGKDLAQPLIDQYGFNRVNWVLANTIQQQDSDDRISPESRRWAAAFPIPQEDHSQAFVVHAHPGLADLFLQDVRKAWQALHLFEVTHCIEDSQNQDYTGKVLALNPLILKNQYQTPEDQLFLARDGFGCDPKAIGRKVFGTFLKDGENAQFQRSDFLGILKEDALPDWAREKLAAMAAQEAEETLSGSMTIQ